MKKNDVRIKDNITVVDEINAIESMVSFYFTDDEYTPYYAEIAEIDAIARFFLDGIEFEPNDNIYSLVMNDPQIYDLILRFYYDIEDSDEARQRNNENQTYINIRSRVVSHVKDMVEYEKSKRVYNDALVKMVEKQNDFLSNLNEFIDVMVSSFSNFAKLDLSQLSSEDMNTAINFMKQLKDKDITEASLANAIKKAAGKHKIPNTKIYEGQRQRIAEQQAQISEKDKEIIDLKKKLEQNKTESNDAE